MSYDTDIEKLEAMIPGLLKEIAEKHQDVIHTVPDYLGVQELKDSAILLRFTAKTDEKISML